jgi:FMN-dependent NADH-azoreductase
LKEKFMNILQINSSARSSGSQSTQLASGIVERLVSQIPEASVTMRDLASNPHPMQDEATLQALFTSKEQRTLEQAERVALDDALIAEIQEADILVLGVPMYNFGVPAQLKHWIDAIARAGVTFKYTENGPIGLLQGKQVFAALTRGGLHKDTPADTIVPYLRTVLGFLGMQDVRMIFAEGLAMGAETADQSLRAAQSEIEAVVV